MNYIAKIFSTKNIEALGRKKTSLIKTLILPGYGNIYINKYNLNYYYTYNNLNKIYSIINFPFIILQKNINEHDILISSYGSGIISQIRSILLTVSKVLAHQDKSYTEILKFFSCLKFDKRIKERRKYGLKKARKAEQYHKR